MAKETKVGSLSYEEAFKELELIVKDLEAEVHNLDQALQLFERGQILAKHCASLLEKAELKVQQLGEDGDLQDLR
jgi:exodeoxyribonuclease VII small subunit